MIPLQRIALLGRILVWRLTWDRCPTDYCPPTPTWIDGS